MWLEPMFLDSPWLFGIPRDVLGLVVGAVGALVWLLWIRRITSIEPPDPVVWRYRADGAPGPRPWATPTPEQTRRGLDSGQTARPDSWLGRRMAVRWWVTRAELAVGAGSIAVTVLLWALRPRLTGEGVWQPGWFEWLAPLGLIGAVIGLVAMLRIAYRDPEARPNIWRSRED